MRAVGETAAVAVHKVLTDKAVAVYKALANKAATVNKAVRPQWCARW